MLYLFSEQDKDIHKGYLVGNTYVHTNTDANFSFHISSLDVITTNNLDQESL